MNDDGLAVAVETCLALAVDKQADSNSSLCAWRATSQDIGHTFGRQALPMLWDFVEGNILSGATRDWLNAVEGGLKTLESLDPDIRSGHAQIASAVAQALPDDSAHCLFTDPPYYNAVPYADLSDFFFVWLKRTLRVPHPDLFAEALAPKADEICEMAGWDPERYPNKNSRWFEAMMGRAMNESRRVLSPDGIGVVVFAHKSTLGWEAQLQAMVDAGWTMTGSWPIDTEMGTRLRAINSAVLASSIHLVCRPRENLDGSLRDGEVGDWRDVLQELPQRIHAWLPRLADEGVVGADAIFACLGPALEVFSRYSRVEKANGDTVSLKEYLEHVWAVVSREALTTIFRDADATGFEPDARLTAMMLWTLNGNAERGMMSDERGTRNDERGVMSDESGGEDEADEAGSAFITPHSSLIIEYDAARKIAQGLGAHLEKLDTVVQVKGDKARLLPVAERARYLFGKEQGAVAATPRRKGPRQASFFPEVEAGEGDVERHGDLGVPTPGATTLDRVHQAMLLFSGGRGDALKRFLVEQGVGADQRFWKLAQALSALYPKDSDEKRWVDGVLARKKGLGM